MNLFFKILFIFFIITSTNANIVKNIKINGNNRISDETIILFGEIKKNKNYNKSELNKILKKLYQTDFFENVVISLDKETLFEKTDKNDCVSIAFFLINFPDIYHSLKVWKPMTYGEHEERTKHLYKDRDELTQESTTKSK